MGILTALGTAGIGSLIAGGLNLGSSLLTNMFNKNQADQSNDLARKNLEWQKEQYFDQKEYNENLQKQLFEREDTSYQRTAEDLQKAGYSPLAINGTNDAGTVVGNPSVPELGTTNPFQAQSLNFGQLADILGQADSRAIEKERVAIEKEKALSDVEQKKLDRQQKQEQFEDTMAQSKEQFNKTLELQKTRDASQASYIDKQKQYIDKQMSAIEQSMSMENDKHKLNTLNQIFKQFTGKDHGNFVFVSENEVENLQQQWMKNFADYCLANGNSLLKNPQSKTEGFNVNAGGELFGQGLQAGGSKNESKTFNYDKAFDNLMDSYLSSNPFPMSERLRPSYY